MSCWIKVAERLLIRKLHELLDTSCSKPQVDPSPAHIHLRKCTSILSRVSCSCDGSCGVGGSISKHCPQPSQSIIISSSGSRCGTRAACFQGSSRAEITMTLPAGPLKAWRGECGSVRVPLPKAFTQRRIKKAASIRLCRIPSLSLLLGVVANKPICVHCCQSQARADDNPLSTSDRQAGWK